MKNPNIKTKIVHSQSKPAWNIIGTTRGDKYKIARVPYVVVDIPEIDERNKNEALNHAEFISYCFNNSDVVCAQHPPMNLNAPRTQD